MAHDHFNEPHGSQLVALDQHQPLIDAIPMRGYLFNERAAAA